MKYIPTPYSCNSDINEIDRLEQINAQLMEAIKQYLEAILDNYELDPSGEIEDKLKDLINKAEGGNK